MANITQKISSYVQGISQQPDHLKRSGQVRELINALPDVTIGCQKRPGSELVATLETTKGGKWFSIFRDANEKYLVQYINGQLRIWSAIDGTPRVVTYSSVPVDPSSPDTPSTPDPLPPPLPAGCNPVVMNQKLSTWLAKKAEADAVANRIENNLRLIEQLKADAKYQWIFQEERYNSANRVGVTNGGTIATSGFWNGLVVKVGDEYRQGPYVEENRNGFLGVLTKWYRIQRWEHIYTLDQTKLDQLNAEIAADSLAIGTLRAEEMVVKKAYESEAVKCGITSSPVRRRSITVNTIPYLEDATPDDIDILTVNDYTFITNKKRVISMGTDKSNVRPYEAFISVKTLEYNTEYKLDITAPKATQDRVVSYATALTVEPADWSDSNGTCPLVDTQTFDRSVGSKINMRYQLETRGQPIPDGQYDYDCKYSTSVTLLNGGEGWVTGDAWTVDMKGQTYTVRVKSHDYTYRYETLINVPTFLTPKDQTSGVLKADAILNHFKTEIEKNFGWFADIIGTGLYIKGTTQFSAYAAGGRTQDALDIMTNKVNNISRLPLQCKDGYVVKILNTGDHDDDYYVKFIGTEKGVDGAGAWEETIAPGIAVNFNSTTMPHQLVRQADGTFLFSPVDWDNREVGDDKTNPQPSFVGNNINKMVFYRNRLAMLSDENIIMSRAGDFFNFWSKTAITVSSDDPIDLAASGTSPTVLHSAQAMQQGLVLFSTHKQFILATSQDVLSPLTARIEEVATYEYNPDSDLVDMGTTIGFLAKSGKYSRYFEMVGISDFTPEVIEPSKIVSELIPSNATEIAQSKENTLVAFGVRDTSDIVLYRYFNDGTKRILSSWFKWDLTTKLIHHAIDENIYYLVSEENGRVILSKAHIVPTSSEYIISDTQTTYTPRLDHYTGIIETFVTYDRPKKESTFLVNHPYTTDATVFGLTSGKNHGRMAKPLSVVPQGDQWLVTLRGDWSQTNIVIGYDYTMKVEFPTIYMAKQAQEQQMTDTRSYLTVHRANLQFGNIGIFNLEVKAPSKADRNYQFEMSPGNDYPANTHEVLPTVFKAVPIYEKNTNASLTLTSTYPTPCTLLSMEWEGKISPKFYRSV